MVMALATCQNPVLREIMCQPGDSIGPTNLDQPCDMVKSYGRILLAIKS